MTQRVLNIIWGILLSNALIMCRLINGQEPPTDRTELRNLSVQHQDMLLHHIGPLFEASEGVGRLYLHLECMGDSDDLFFPRMELKSTSKGHSTLATLRDAFANIKDVTIAKRQSGIIGIWIGHVSNDFLGTRIDVLKLNPSERYNEFLAIKAILNTKEVEQQMRELRMEPAPMFVIHSILDPDRKLPHLPASMANLTVDEALDRIAQTFHGLVIYKECKGKDSRLFSIHLRELQN